MEEQRLYGLKNEVDIIDYLNKKNVSNLNEKWKKHIIRMFPYAKDDSFIIAKHYPDNSAKPDIIIDVDGEEKYVSIKTGKCPSMHQESYFSFERFLKRNGVSIRTLQIIKFYHYGDSKKLGNFDRPLSGEELRQKYSNYFLEASMELDKNKIIEATVDRTVIRGTNPTARAIDFLYYGDLEHGNLLSKHDIYSIVLAYRKHDRTPIHLGALCYLPSSRKVGRSERNYVRIKFPLLSFLYYVNEEEIERMKKGTFTR